jgi:peroxiredoxin
LVAASAILTFSSFAYAGKFNKVLNVGDKAPEWKGLTGIDDKTHSLAELKDAKAVVVIFTCNKCPIAMDYEERIVQFTADYKDKKVAVVAINVNSSESESLAKIKERAKEKDFNFIYLKDPSQEIGRKYGATVTPHVFVLDQNRRIAYMGNFDDNLEPAKIEHRSTREAVDAVLSGKTPEITETKQFGCGIDYK